MPHRIRRLAREATNRLFAPYVVELGDRTGAAQTSVEALRRELGETRTEVRDEAGATRRTTAEAIAALDARTAAIAAEVSDANELLHHVYEEGSAQRRRLEELRASEEYELAFTEPEPLVSFVVPTYKRFESLRDVSLPSILAQEYSNIEVIVVGDCAPAETEQVIADFDDPRIRFHNRPVRGPYPDESVRWYVIGTPPFNEAVSMARGRWIAALGDDDTVRPEHTKTLLQAAREHRYEHCYGRHRVHYPSGETLEIGSFPPQRGEYVLQAALYHSGLRFFQMQAADYLLSEPNDWSLCRRMLAAGVRFGMVEDFLADKYESRYQSHADWGLYGDPSVD